jgi:Spy/CpxP family protein refolding chaperone
MKNVNLIRKRTAWFSLLAIFVAAASLWADDDMKMGGMAPAPASAAPAKAMGMCCMGEMGMPPGGGAGMSATAPPPGMAGMSGSSGMAAMSGPSSAMPGQPGASHLLHMGSTGFFLNHSQHITLTADQKSKLNRLKEKAMLDQASQQRRIDQGEQELYSLTGADQPDNAGIQAKLGEIEKLRAEQRMNFIRAVGEASNVLTHDQHQALMMGGMPAGKK